MRCGLVWRGEESWSAGEEGDGMEEDRTGVWAVAWPGSLPGPWPGAAVRDGPSALHGERDRPELPMAPPQPQLSSLTVRLGHPVFYLALLN